MAVMRGHSTSCGGRHIASCERLKRSVISARDQWRLGVPLRFEICHRLFGERLTNFHCEWRAPLGEAASISSDDSIAGSRVAGVSARSSTNRRIAEDRLLPCLRALSISATVCDSDAFWARAICFSALQNASSRLTLVLCPAIRIERLTIPDFMSVPQCLWFP